MVLLQEDIQIRAAAPFCCPFLMFTGGETEALISKVTYSTEGLSALTPTTNSSKKKTTSEQEGLSSIFSFPQSTQSLTAQWSAIVPL